MTRRTHRFFGWLSTLLAGLMLSPALAEPPAATPVAPATAPAAPQAAPAPLANPPAAEPGPAEGRTTDRWYVLELFNARTGYMHLAETVLPDRIRSTSKLRMTIKRGQLAIDIAMDNSSEETLDGKPISMHTRQALGSAPTEEKWTFLPDGVEVSTTANSKTTTSKKPLPTGEWLTPAATERAVKLALKRDEKTIVVRTVDPSVGLRTIGLTRRIMERTNADVFGKTVPAIKWATVVDLFPTIESVEFVDEDGESVRSETILGGIKFVQLLADKELALRPVDAPELLESTFITPSRHIPNARKVTDAVYLLTAKEGTLADLPNAPGQRAERIDAGSVRVSVATTESGRAARPVPTTFDRAPFLAATPAVDHKDPEIIKLLAQAKVDGLAPPMRAERLRRFVYDYITKKDMSVGFATASEVARTKVGDCSEHGVLLAALLRAAGIPSRVCSGVVYVDIAKDAGIFGYHMWTEALIEDGGAAHWVALDAALDQRRPFDATHIVFSHSSLGEHDTTNFMVAFSALFHRLNIKVEKAE